MSIGSYTQFQTSDKAAVSIKRVKIIENASGDFELEVTNADADRILVADANSDYTLAASGTVAAKLALRGGTDILLYGA